MNLCFSFSASFSKSGCFHRKKGKGRRKGGQIRGKGEKRKSVYDASRFGKIITLLISRREREGEGSGKKKKKKKRKEGGEEDSRLTVAFPGPLQRRKPGEIERERKLHEKKKKKKGWKKIPIREKKKGK